MGDLKDDSIQNKILQKTKKWNKNVKIPEVLMRRTQYSDLLEAEYVFS